MSASDTWFSTCALEREARSKSLQWDFIPQKNGMRRASILRFPNSILFKVLLPAAFLSALIVNARLLLWHQSGRLDSSGQLALPAAPQFGAADAAAGHHRRISQHDSQGSYSDSSRPSVDLEAWCSSGHTALAIDGVLLVNDTAPGYHVFIVNQATASLMGHHPAGSWEMAEAIALSVSAGRLLVLTRVPEASSAPAGSWSGRFQPGRAFRSLGSREFASLGPADTWILIAFARVGRISEDRRAGGGLLRLQASIKLTLKEETICPLWPPGDETARRRQFCGQVDGFSNVCSCTEPSRISFVRRPLPWFSSPSAVVPITVMSSNRPQFLYRTLTSLLQLHGLNGSQAGALLHGYFEQPRLICELLQVGHSQRSLAWRDSGSASLYRLGLADSLRRFQTAQYVVLLEDDVDPSPDLIDFFNQTLPLFARDPNLFCIGAWNDQSFVHTSSSPSLLYRTQLTPLKAVAFSRRLWEEELISQWPEEPMDLPHWLSSVMGPQRYCLQPVLSRVFVYSQAEQLLNQQKSSRHLTSIERNCRGNCNRLLIQSTPEYEGEIQALLNRAVRLDNPLAKQCETAFPSALQAAKNSTASGEMAAFLLPVRVRHRAAVRSFWKAAVARCFMLGPEPTCLYKGLCLVRFAEFILIVNFKPFSQFKVPSAMADIEFP